MKKIALTSFLAVFAVSAANAATNYFVGGSAAIATDNDHDSGLIVAPEFGWKLNSNWDLGLGAHFGYDHKDRVTINGTTGAAEGYYYGAGAFARYKVGQLGGIKLLLKGSAYVDFETYSPDQGDSETATSIDVDVTPMITYDISESFTLYANLNFLGVHAGYDFKNDKLGINKNWGFAAGADTDDLANTSDFQIGFTYNF